VRALKINGFTFIRKGIDVGCPFVPAIRSLRPLRDQIVVNVPRFPDDQPDTIQIIGLTQGVLRHCRLVK
jgi:hypothetical protein